MPLTLVVGERETAEFHRQSAVLATAWAMLRPTVIDIAEANHFTVIDGLAEPGSDLHRVVVGHLEAATQA